MPAAAQAPAQAIEAAAPLVVQPGPAEAAAIPPRVRRQQAKPRVSTREPQPVKWWIKSKG